MIRREHFKLIGIFTIVGIIMSVLTSVIIRFIVRNTNEWTLEMGSRYNLIDAVVSVIVIGLIVFFYIRKQERVDVFKGLLILLVYSLIALVIERITMMTALAPYFYLWIFVPRRIFQFIGSWMIRTEIFSVYVSVLVSYLVPFVLVIFGKKTYDKQEGLEV